MCVFMCSTAPSRHSHNVCSSIFYVPENWFSTWQLVHPFPAFSRFWWRSIVLGIWFVSSRISPLVYVSISAMCILVYMAKAMYYHVYYVSFRVAKQFPFRNGKTCLTKWVRKNEMGGTYSPIRMALLSLLKLFFTFCRRSSGAYSKMVATDRRLQACSSNQISKRAIRLKWAFRISFSML